MKLSDDGLSGELLRNNSENIILRFIQGARMVVGARTIAKLAMGNGGSYKRY